MSGKMTKIAVFIDGNFFLKVNTYYRYHHERRSNISFRGLFDFIRNEVSILEKTEANYCQIVESHWFRGRYSTVNLEKRYPDEQQRMTQMTNERKIDDTFMHQGIVTHYFPVSYDYKTNEYEEKGIDVWLSLEAYEIATLKKFDVMVLIAGDSDYVPLIRKINGIGTRVMILGWDFEYESYNESQARTFKHYTRTSQSLIEECSYPIMMDKKIDDRTSKNSSVVNSIFNFVQPYQVGGSGGGFNKQQNLGTPPSETV